MNSKQQIDFLVKLRDALQMAADATNEYLETFAPKDVKDEKTAVLEETFNILKFEPQQGARIGEFEIASKVNNAAEKWTQAFNLLVKSNATIKDRYHGREYVYSYWIFGEGKIYRQKLKLREKKL
jgi:hypothetical protein